MNITLSAPSETVRAVRQWAEREHTSLNQYIRDCLEEKAAAVEAERKRKSAEFAKFLASLHADLPADYVFDREEANARR